MYCCIRSSYWLETPLDSNGSCSIATKQPMDFATAVTRLDLAMNFSKVFNERLRLGRRFQNTEWNKDR